MPNEFQNLQIAARDRPQDTGCQREVPHLSRPNPAQNLPLHSPSVTPLHRALSLHFRISTAQTDHHQVQLLISATKS